MKRIKRKNCFLWFFLCAVSVIVILLVFKFQPQNQAARSLKLLYTANISEQPNFSDSGTLTELYREKFESCMTQNGIDDAIRLRLPYKLLNRERRIERTSADHISLTGVDGLRSKDSVCYLFKVQVTTYYDSDSPQPTPETQTAEGAVYLKRTGFFNWKTDRISIK